MNQTIRRGNIEISTLPNLVIQYRLSMGIKPEHIDAVDGSYLEVRRKITKNKQTSCYFYVRESQDRHEILRLQAEARVAVDRFKLLDAQNRLARSKNWLSMVPEL